MGGQKSLLKSDRRYATLDRAECPRLFNPEPTALFQHKNRNACRVHTMRIRNTIWIRTLSISGLICLAGTARGDEGMWLLNDLPTQLLTERYDFAPSDEWSRHIMLSSVRFSSGGSASFVSSNGLVLTNHHVAADTLNKLSTPENNYYENGFLRSRRKKRSKPPTWSSTSSFRLKM